jgi:calcineurin-like phosphoesterase family protein
VALGRIAETLPLVQRLNGAKFLVPGNHDRCWHGHSRVRPRDIEMYEEVGFSILPSYWWFNLPLPDGDFERVRVCHLPYAGDSHDNDRYAEHRPVDTGHWLLHGHVHEKWVKRDRQINVGVDVWGYTPVCQTVLGSIVAGSLIVE